MTNTFTSDKQAQLLEMLKNINDRSRNGEYDETDDEIEELFVTAFDHNATIEFITMMKNLDLKMIDYDCVNEKNEYCLSAIFDNASCVVVQHDRDTKTSKISIIIRKDETMICADNKGIFTSDIVQDDDIHEEHIRKVMKKIEGIDNDVENMNSMEFDENLYWLMIVSCKIKQSS